MHASQLHAAQLHVQARTAHYRLLTKDEVCEGPAGASDTSNARDRGGWDVGRNHGD